MRQQLRKKTESSLIWISLMKTACSYKSPQESRSSYGVGCRAPFSLFGRSEPGATGTQKDS